MAKSDIASKSTDSQKIGASLSEGAQGAGTQQPPASQTGTPSPDIQALIEKAIHDDRMTEGRKLKNVEAREAALTPREKAIQEAEARRQQEAQEREAAELDEALNEVPEAQREAKKANLKSVIQKTQDARKALDADLRQYRPILDTLKELGITDGETLRQTVLTSRATALEMTVFTIAEKNGVSAELLKDKAARLKITDEAGLNEIASVMPKKAEVHEVDSGKTTGGEKPYRLSDIPRIQAEIARMADGPAKREANTRLLNAVRSGNIE